MEKYEGCGHFWPQGLNFGTLFIVTFAFENQDNLPTLQAKT